MLIRPARMERDAASREADITASPHRFSTLASDRGGSSYGQCPMAGSRVRGGSLLVARWPRVQKLRHSVRFPGDASARRCVLWKETERDAESGRRAHELGADERDNGCWRDAGERVGEDPAEGDGGVGE